MMITTGADLPALFLITLSVLLSLAIVGQTVLEARGMARPPYRVKEGVKVSVILPIKGLDPMLRETLKSLIDQDYRNKELIVVLDSAEDPSFPIVREFPVRVLIRRPCSECSGKVAAILTALEEAKGDILVFVDSDTVYPQGWLSCLVSLVSEDKVATTFSWPFPVSLTLRNALRSGFWTLGFEPVFSRPSRLLWGGSMAFPKSFFTDNVKSVLAKAWCDDCTLTALAKARGMSIEFCSIIPQNWFDEKDLTSFVKRQVITVKMYSPRGFRYFMVLWGIILTLLAVSPLYPITALPVLAWIAKNLVRARRAKGSVIPALFSPLGATVAFIVGLLILREDQVVWRGARIRVKG
jgi:hypothetical protein